jgi:hypothetical protein
MAKVRVQAHGSKAESSVDGKPAKPKYNGALDVLKKVYKSDGLVGWYRVRLRDGHQSLGLTLSTGYGSPNTQGSPRTGLPIRVKGPV